MQTPILYRLARALLRGALNMYFGKIERSGVKNVPASGPLILASNHPQSITDAFVLSLCAGRPLHYLARSGLFHNRWRAWFLRHAGVIPVYRPHEVADAAERNVAIFSECYRLLDRDGAICIFPEGTSADERRVRKLRTGTARIALEAEARNDWRLGAVIVPVGLNFESQRRIRTRVLANFGRPIAVADYRKAYEDDPVETVNRLTEDLQQAIRRRVVNIERSEFEALVRDVELVYKGELLAREGISIPGGTKFKREQLLSREISRALDYFFEYHPEVVWSMGALLREYHRKLERFHLKDEVFQAERKTTAATETGRFVMLGALGLPFALYGAFWNFVPYKVTGWIGGGKARDATKIHFRQLLWGAILYALYYVPIMYMGYRLLGGVGVTIFAATLAPTGLFARAYTRHMVQRRRMLRFAYLELTHRYLVQKLRRQRDGLIEEMDAAMEEYLDARGHNPAGASPPLGTGNGQ